MVKTPKKKEFPLSNRKSVFTFAIPYERIIPIMRKLTLLACLLTMVAGFSYADVITPSQAVRLHALAQLAYEGIVEDLTAGGAATNASPAFTSQGGCTDCSFPDANGGCGSGCSDCRPESADSEILP